MIRRSGENIAAAEVESVLMLHSEVKMAACVPVPDDIRGEEVKAYIIPKNSVQDIEGFFSELIKHAEKMLAKFKVPRYWELADSFPLTPSERIAKHLIIEQKENLVEGAYDSVDCQFK